MTPLNASPSPGEAVADQLRPGQTDKGESLETRARTFDGSLRKSWRPLVTTRIGFLFVLAAGSTLLFALAANLYAESRALNAMMWVATIAVCSLSGLISMRSARTLRTIEGELRRSAGDPRRWHAARPIIGSDEITDGWNELLQEIESAHQHPTSRSPAGLDEEAITLARAMRGLPVSWVITDLSGCILFLNAPTCSLFNLKDTSNHVGRDLLDLLGLRVGNPESISKGTRLLSNVQMIRQRHELEINGQTLHLRISRSRLAGRSGDAEGLAWVLLDATQQELATRSRDQFLMTATHELRTPLNNLQAYAEALQSEEQLEIDRQKEFCNIIVSEANRLGRLVDQLLTVGQLEAGSMVANRHELDLLPMLHYVVEQVSAQATKKNQKLLTKFSPKLPAVLADREKLQAALVNLVGNAVKYTQDGGEITLRCSTEDQWIRIDIQDNGPGIASEEQPKVFDKFFRGTQADESEQRGNGLGLAFAREIMRMHGGEIDLESRVGEGSVFTVRLPFSGPSRSGI